MLPFSEACERNKGPILERLRTVLAGSSRVLEIGSGTGQHAVYFAAQLPHLLWQPTERLAYLPDLATRIRNEGSTNLLAPALLDVTQPLWPVGAVDVVFTANTLHIMSWPEVVAMFDGLRTRLASSGLLCIYGPFRYDGRYTSPSNQAFDRMLRERDQESGIRDLAEVSTLAAACGLTLLANTDLPAFNQLLVFG